MDQRIPPILHPILQDYTQRTEQEVPGQIAALYLEGSIALDSFNPRLSDIDFIAILGSKATSNDFKKILRIHKAIDRNTQDGNCPGCISNQVTWDVWIVRMNLF